MDFNAFVTSFLPWIVFCHPGKRTIFTISSIVLGYLINSLLTTSIRFTKEKLKLILAPVSIVAVLALFSVTNGFGYYNRIPDMEKIESVNVISSFNFNEFFSTTEENDFTFDEIGSRLKIKELQRTKGELLEALQIYYKVFFLGEDM